MPQILLRRNDYFERKSSLFGTIINLKSRHGAKPETVSVHWKNPKDIKNRNKMIIKNQY
jgi:hypothetical protein